jgi:hypothetical protein
MSQIPFNGPFIGLNTRKESSRLEAGEAESAENVNLDRSTLKTRPGHTVLGTQTGLPLGAFDYRNAAGVAVQILKVGSVLYKASGWTISAITDGTGLSSTNMADFVAVNNRVYFCDGASGLKVTDGSNVYTAQIDRPSAMSAPSVSSQSMTAGPFGVYSYKYTHYSSTWGQESPSSDVSALIEVTDPSGDRISLTGMDASGDARVDKIRIYRKRVSSSETLWRLVDTIAIGTTYDDDLPDSEVSRTTFAPLSVDDPVPTGVAHLTHQNGIMLAVEEDSNVVYYSLPSRPWVMVNSLPIGSDQDSDPVTALFSHGGLAYAVKHQSLWVISGNTEDTIGSSLISNEGGCYSAHSLVHAKEGVYWWGENKAWRFAGDRPMEISDPVEPEISGRKYSRDAFIVGAYDYDTNAVIWSYTPSSASTNTKQLVFFERNSADTNKLSWAFWDLGTISTLLRYTDTTTKDRNLCYATSVGEFRKLTEDVDDAGTAVKITWRTGKMHFGLPTRNKAFHDVEVDSVPSTSPARLGLRYRIDNNEAPFESGAFWDPKDRPLKPVRLSRRARMFRMEIYSTAGLVEVLGWSMSVDPVGRRE